MITLAGCVIVKDNKVLMVKEGKKECFEQWNFPSGHIEEGENIIDGALRETFEETGCRVKLVGLLPISQIFADDDTYILFRFKAEIVDENLNVDHKEILDVKWIDIEDIKKMKKEDIRAYSVNIKVIEELEQGKVYPLDILDKNMYGIN